MISVFYRLYNARNDESGFSTAELLGNAALGVLALVAIWALIGGNGGLGERVVDYIESQIIK